MGELYIVCDLIASDSFTGPSIGFVRLEGFAQRAEFGRELSRPLCVERRGMED